MQPATTIHIALDPDLDIGPAAFTRAWNRDVATSTAGRAHITRAPGAPATENLLDPGTQDLLISIATGLATSVIYDAIIAIYKQRFGKEADVEIVETYNPQGEKMLVVRVNK